MLSAHSARAVAPAAEPVARARKAWGSIGEYLQHQVPLLVGVACLRPPSNVAVAVVKAQSHRPVTADMSTLAEGEHCRATGSPEAPALPGQAAERCRRRGCARLAAQDGVRVGALEGECADAGGRRARRCFQNRQRPRGSALAGHPARPLAQGRLRLQDAAHVRVHLWVCITHTGGYLTQYVSWNGFHIVLPPHSRMSVSLRSQDMTVHAAQCKNSALAAGA